MSENKLDCMFSSKTPDTRTLKPEIMFHETGGNDASHGSFSVGSSSVSGFQPEQLRVCACFVYTRLRRKSLSVTESDCETVTFRSLKHEADRNVLVFPIVWSSTGAPDSTVVLYLVELCSYFIPDVSERASESEDGFNTLSTSRHSHNK